MIKVSVLAGRKELKQAMWATKGRVLKNIKPLKDDTMRKAIKAQHGTLNKYIFHVIATVPNRVHDHIRTHHLVNEFYQCSTSRPDLTKDNGKNRVIDFYLPMKRAIEIMGLRLCSKSWSETRSFFYELKLELIKIEPALKDFLVPRCCHSGYCPEPNSCGFDKSDVFIDLRSKMFE